MLQKNNLFILTGLALILVFVVVYLKNKNDNRPLRLLPYYGPKTYSNNKDTVYHTVPDFEFIDQSGKKINQETIKNKIYVCDYFFVTCQSICPIMSKQMERIATKFSTNKDFVILSHTVNPEEDSVSVLFEYAKQHHANPSQWFFLTGNKKELYKIAREGYLLNAEEGNGDENDFIHTQNFALIDKERRIRGFYDGTDSLDVNRLITDIQLLFEEYKWREK